MGNQRVHVDDTSDQVRSDQTNDKPDEKPADEDDHHDEKDINALEHLMSMKKQIQPREKFLDNYAFYRQGKEENKNWFRIITHMKRNMYVDHSWGCFPESREKIIRLIESTKAEVFILVLVVTDMVMVIIEITIDSLFDFDYDGHRRRLAGVGNNPSCKIENAYNVASSCRIVSITILCVFALELLVKFLCAPVGFCKHFGHALDVIVVGGSLVFEFTLHHSAGALLIFFRCWRGVRVLHGLYEQIEYISKALETEAHLDHALDKVNKYKQFTKNLQVRDQWKTFKHTLEKEELEAEQLKDLEENKEEEDALRSSASCG